VVWKAAYTPYGSAVVDEDPDGDGTAVTFNIRFPGQYFDAKTGLHYNYFRDYDPTSGRYIESDPVGLEGGVNTYAYVGNNPLTRIDPYGLWSFSFGAYAGVGGAILIGQDPSTGQWFYGGRLGIGLGGGASFDYKGKRPSGDDGSSCGHGTTYGDFINAGVSVGPYQYDPIDAHAGYDTTTGQGYHTGPLNDGGITFGNGTGFEIGGAFGVEVVGH
jgi:RHS repeat-associated protein